MGYIFRHRSLHVIAITWTLPFLIFIRTRPHLIRLDAAGLQFCFLQIPSAYAVSRLLFMMFHIGSNRLHTVAPKIPKKLCRARVNVPARNALRSRATMAVLSPAVRPLQPPPGSEAQLGARIDGVDLERLTGEKMTRTPMFHTEADMRRRTIRDHPQRFVSPSRHHIQEPTETISQSTIRAHKTLRSCI